MKKAILTLLCICSINGIVNAQTDGGKYVEKLCGCFSVNFKYAETFSPHENYKYHDREEMNATELVVPVEKDEHKIILQHLLVINDSFIIKHWREEWVYESPILYEYKGDRIWQQKTLSAAEVKGRWTQTVWQVSDEPRYQGAGSWIENNNDVYWESTTDAPLPRREYKVRDDYNIMQRRNRIAITADGYMHEQDNKKIIRKGGVDDLLAEEKGYNTYYKMDNSMCASARRWWKENEEFWTVVRKDWNDIITEQKVVKLKLKVDDKVLNEHLDELWKQWKSKNIATTELNQEVDKIIRKFLITS